MGAAAVTTGSSWESSLSRLAHGEAAGQSGMVTARDCVFVDWTSHIPVRTEKGSQLQKALSEIPRDGDRLLFL